MKKIFLFLLAALFAAELSAQELTVISFEPQPTDLTAKIGNRKDLNGDICGAVRVQIAAPNVLFSGNVIGEVETRFGEYVVFLAKNSRHLRVYHKDYIFTPLDYEIPLKIESKQTYLLKLEVPVYTHYNDIMLERDKRKRPQYGFEQHIEASFKISSKEEILGNEWSWSAKRKLRYTLNANWIGGKRFGNAFYLGVGVGVGFSKYNIIDGPNLANSWSSTYNSRDFNGGVFLHPRIYFTKGKLQPFIAFSLGCLYSDDNHYGSRFKAYLNPEVGLNFRIKEHFSFYITGGYASQFDNFNGWQFKLGVTL